MFESLWFREFGIPSVEIERSLCARVCERETVRERV